MNSKKKVNLSITNKTSLGRLRVAIDIRNNLNAGNVVIFRGHEIFPPVHYIESKDPFGREDIVLRKRVYLNVRDCYRILKKCLKPCRNELGLID